MPSGAELTGQIAKLVTLEFRHGSQLTNGDHVIWQAVRQLVDQHGWGGNRFLASGRAVAEAMQLALSIDTFLESHTDNPEFVQLGKLGIARAIALAEGRSRMAPQSDGFTPFRMTGLADTWYYSLARQLFTGVRADEPRQAFANVTFVVFNYDRCLQVFLKRAVEMYFRVTQQEADELVRQIRIIHPYGSIGSVFEGTEGYLPFAADRNDLNALARRIRTFSETSREAKAITAAVQAAETLIFLGFGFHDQNMALLDVSEKYGIQDPPPRQVFATTMGMSPSDESIVREQLSCKLWGAPSPVHGSARISTSNGTCAELFSAYWRSLTG